LHFCGGVNEGAQGIARKGVVIAASVDVLELLRFVVVPLGIRPFEEEALNFVCRVERVAFLL